MKQYLLDQIDTKELKIGIIGLGYVGLPLAVECAKAGFHTVGFDISAEKAESIKGKIIFKT